MRRLTGLAIGVGATVAVAAWAVAQTSSTVHSAGPSPELRILAKGRLLCESRDAVLAGALAFLHAGLDISAAQEQDWQRFSAAATQGVASFADACAAIEQQQTPPARLIDRLGIAERFAEAHLQAMQAIQPALTELYGRLTPDQQERLDSLPFGKRP